MDYRDIYRLTNPISDAFDRMEVFRRSSQLPPSLTQQMREMSAVTRMSESLATATDPFRDLNAATRAYREDLVASSAYREELAASSAYREELATRMMVASDLIQHDAAERLSQVRDLLPKYELDEIRRFDTAIQASLAGVQWNRISTELSHLTDQMVTAYRDLAIESPETESPFDLDSLPSFELYAHASLLGGLSQFGAGTPSPASGSSSPSRQPEAGAPSEEEAQDEHEAVEAEALEELEEGSEVTLESRLAEYAPHLLELHWGAEEVRTDRYYAPLKFCAAKRELLRKLLQEAAPDQVIREWTTDPKYISQCDKRMPTWPGRIAYVCEQAQRSGYTGFIVTDVKAVSKVWKLLNKGTHQVPGRMTDREVTKLSMRSNGVVLMILELVMRAKN